MWLYIYRNSYTCATCSIYGFSRMASGILENNVNDL